MEFLANNTGNIALALIVVYSIMKMIAPYTKGTVDDQIVKAIDDTKAWVEKNAPDAWTAVEALATKGAVNGSLQKLALFLQTLNEHHIEEHGVPLPSEAIPAAKRQAAAISAADSLAKKATASVPTVAPASK